MSHNATPSKSRNQKEAELIRELFVGKGGRIAKAVFFITLKALPVWTLPVITARIIDLGSQEHPSVRLLVTYVLIAVFLIIQNLPAAIYYIGNLVHVTRGIGRDLRIRICNQLQVLSLHYHSRSSVGTLHSKAIRDIEIIELIPKLGLEQGYTLLLGGSISSIAILIRKPEALVYFLIAVPLCSIVSSRFGRRMSQSVNDYRKSMEGMSTHLNEMVAMIPITRAHGLEEHQLRSVESGIQGVFDKGVHFDKLTGLFGAVSWVTMGVMQITFLGGSMYACFLNKITIGDVVMFNAFFITLSNSLANLLNFVPQLLQTRESLDSVIEILDSSNLEENNGKPPFQNLSGEFRFENVHFRYPETDGPVIHDFSLHLEAGTSLAIVGPSGCGKSTLLSLALGFANPQAGRILLDGKALDEMDLRTYRQNVGVVNQDPIFFSGSIRENVAYGNDDLTDPQIFHALEMANARDFVLDLPQSLDTRIGVDGVRLSGGQLQRLAIARAIIRNPKVLVLDEATSALDTESEARVQQAIDNAMKDRTTFIVAHRMSTVKNAERIAILETGHLVACDTPENLLKTDNFYSRAVKNTATETPSPREPLQ